MSNKKNGGHLTVQYNLRWTEEMREKIAQEAKRNTRSMNQEIIARLEKSLESDNTFESDNNLDVVENNSTNNEKFLLAVAAALKALEQSNQKNE